MFQVNYKETKMMFLMFFSVFTANFEHISHLAPLRL